MNYQIEVFREKLVKLLNESGLPIGVAYYVLKDCLNELELGYRKAIFNEKNRPQENASEEFELTAEEQLDENDVK